MDAITKTGSIIRKNLLLSQIIKNDSNPNEMSKAEFNLLVNNIEKTGITDPILVRPLPDGKYRIVGGHHRFDAAALLDFSEVPCTVITDPDFDDDMEKYQVVRMNMIHGKLNAKKFIDLYNSLDKKYESDIMADAFGFSDEDQFKKLIGQMSKSLPSSLRDEFKKAAEEIKTVDGLSKLLNQMFTKHGKTLPQGYMIVDFGGVESIWLKMDKSDKSRFSAVADKCSALNRGVDSLFRLFMQSIAEDALPSLMEDLKLFPAVEAGEVPSTTPY